MTRVLLVTNDFPPRRGGIQSYLEQFVVRLAATGEHAITVYAPQWKGAGTTTAPHPCGSCGTRHADAARTGVERRMHDLITAEDIEAVWFGAAAPLALLAGRPAGPARTGSWPARTVTRWAGRCCRSRVRRCAESGTPPTW